MGVLSRAPEMDAVEFQEKLLKERNTCLLEAEQGVH